MVYRLLKTETDVSCVKGNVSEEEKRLALKIFTHFVSTCEKSYGADVGQRLKLVEVNVWDRDGQAATGQTIFEIDVTKAHQILQVFGIITGRSGKCDRHRRYWCIAVNEPNMAPACTTIWDGDQVCVTAVHSTVNPWATSKKEVATKTRL
ncbi:hypothetical protein C0995_007288 [Termitomyces sp. Mi166|nr:hypothetical protein C0995_007288 [Termitomyces sp. Mi166\